MATERKEYDKIEVNLKLTFGEVRAIIFALGDPDERGDEIAKTLIEKKVHPGYFFSVLEKLRQLGRDVMEQVTWT